MNAIEIKDVHKSFKIYFDKGSTLKEKILFKNRNRHEIHQVLKGITFSIKKGEVVGLIGENGCGKSTLLKLMTRIIYPDKGSIQVNGKVSSLLELGAGFHPDMSGRENIYTNASIFGLSKKEIDSRIEKIIEFSELGEFIDNPVRTYSSGMYMRLAFSVAINVDADILLIDEILAVGDAAFQAKCFNKMQEIKSEGTTIVIVSHDLGSIERLCNRAIWINKGLKVVDDRPHDVAAMYMDNIMNKESVIEKEILEEKQKENNADEKCVPKEKKDEMDSKRTGNKYVEIKDIKLLVNDQETNRIKTGEDIVLSVSYVRNNKMIKESVMGIGIFRNDGLNCFGTNTYLDSNSKLELKDSGCITVVLKKVMLLEGQYKLDVAFHDEYGQPYDYIREAKSFSMYSAIKDTGVTRIEHEFIISK